MISVPPLNHSKSSRDDTRIKVDLRTAFDDVVIAKKKKISLFVHNLLFK